MDPKITVDSSVPGRLIIGVERRSVRIFTLAYDEAAYLEQLLHLALAKVGGQ